MADMMKAMGGASKRGPLGRMAQMFGMGGGMPQPEQIAEMQKQMEGGGGMGAMPKLPSTPPPGLTGGNRLRRMPGLPGLGRKPRPAGPRRVQPVRKEEVIA